MKIGERIGTEIRDVAFGGDGVGRYEERVIFVPFTVDGEEVEVEITEVKKRYARGRLLRVVVPSPYRVIPFVSLLHPLRRLSDAAYLLPASVGAQAPAGD